MEIGGDWRKKKKKEEEQLEPLGAVVKEWKLVGWLVWTLSDLLANNLFLDNIFYFKF